MPDEEKDPWKTLPKVPLAVWDRLLILFYRVLLVNDEAASQLFDEDEKVRLAARVRACELLSIVAADIPDGMLRNG